MADDKKSFVLYVDMIHTVEQMPDDKAGQLLKHILEYVNDRDPETKDLLIKIAFEPIKQQLKRDLKRWEGIQQKRSDAGKASAEKRSSKKQQKATKSTSVKKDQHSSANPTVSVNGTVSVSGNVTGSGIKEISYPHGSPQFLEAWSVWKRYKKEQHRFTYKSQISEQTALDNLGGHDEATAILMIRQSIGQGYKGIFPLKDGVADKPKFDRFTSVLERMEHQTKGDQTDLGFLKLDT